MPIPGTSTYESRGIEMAVAELPSFGTRMRTMVSVLDATSSPARSESSSSWDSGLPWASVRLSVPTMRMSTAPSALPPSPRPPAVARLLRSESMLRHANPVTTSASTDSTATAM